MACGPLPASPANGIGTQLWDMGLISNVAVSLSHGATVEALEMASYRGASHGTASSDTLDTLLGYQERIIIYLV